MDNLKTTGLYKMGGATDISSYITDYGVLLVLAYDDTHICQIKTGANDLHIGVRFYTGTWSSWTVIR